MPVLFPRQPQLDDLLLAVNGSDQNARVVAVFLSVGIPHHHERPFTFVALFPVQRKARKVVPEIEADHHGGVFLYSRPKYFLHELSTRVEREARRE